jgi:ATP-dependent Clp protease ATP-binding subunit ClpC
MFERFTDRARRVVVLAQEEARLLNHNYIGTEHLLLGLIREDEGIAARALQRLDVSLEAVRSRVQEIIGVGASAQSGHIPFTPRAKKVLELSLREALQLGHDDIGTEHILLGLVREGEGVAAQVLVRLGVDLARVRHEVVQLLSSDAPTGGAATRAVFVLETPAAERARREARRLAGERPVGTHDILAAIVRDNQSAGAKALAALGVTADALDAALAALDPAETSDQTPEEAGARRLLIDVRDDSVAVVLADDALRERLAGALAGEPKVVRPDDAAARSFPALWRDLTRHLADVLAALEENAQSWRPPEWDRDWDVAAYAVVQGPGGMQSFLEVAEGVPPAPVRATLGRWLMANQPEYGGGAGYLAILVREAEGSQWSYDLSFGDRPQGAQTRREYLVAYAIFDLTPQPSRRREA